MSLVQVSFWERLRQEDTLWIYPRLLLSALCCAVERGLRSPAVEYSVFPDVVATTIQFCLPGLGIILQLQLVLPPHHVIQCRGRDHSTPRQDTHHSGRYSPS